MSCSVAVRMIHVIEVHVGFYFNGSYTLSKRFSLSQNSAASVEDQNSLRLRVIADTLPAYVAYVDTSLCYAMANRMYEEQFGRGELEIVGRPVAEVLGGSFENVAWRLRAALRGEAQLFESPMLTKQGERFLLVRHIPDRDPEGHVRGVIVHGVDITERKRSEQVLLETEKLAAVGRLASSIAHEINNPLESVVNLVYLIEMTALSDAEQAVRYAQLAQQELARVSQIATQTLRFFKQATKPSLANISELVDSVLTLYAGRLLNSAVAVERRFDEGMKILCFEGEVRQVLNNLVSNALDAMKLGGRLIVRTRRGFDWETGRTGCRITVADTGDGMSPETLARLFEAFYTTKGIGGTGLGLWVSSGIVKKHGGRLDVKSSASGKSRGSVFVLFLPALPS